MRKNNTNESVLSLHRELESVYNSGKIVKVVNSPAKDGIDIMLDFTITKDQAENISRYIKTKYKFDALFYQKTHLIKVFYKT
jgi:hypothetical protein